MEHNFYIQNVEQLALALKNRVALKFFTVLNILFTFRSFEQLALALKNRVCPEIFQAREGGSPPDPPPRTPMSVQRLLGFVNYLSRFLPKLSHICEPLRRLTDKGAPWMWTSRHTEAVEAIKTAVTESPVLRYYDVNEKLQSNVTPAKLVLELHCCKKGSLSRLRQERSPQRSRGMRK